MDKHDVLGRRRRAAQPEEERRALGKRLASARTLAGFTIDAVAKTLTERGHPITKQAVGHWETGKNVPDALWLKRLAKLYNTTLDALVWDEAISMEAVQVAVQYDALTQAQKKAFAYVWLAFVQGGKSDAEVERDMPATRPENRPAVHEPQPRYIKEGKP